MSSTKKIPIRINFLPEGPTPRIRIHQYSYGTIVTLQGGLFYGVEEYDTSDSWFSGASKKVSYRRSDGETFEETATGTASSGNDFSFKITKDMTAVAGPVVVSLGLVDGTTNILWSQNFILDVEPHPVQEGEA